jgi:hypothetical protein
MSCMSCDKWLLVKETNQAANSNGTNDKTQNSNAAYGQQAHALASHVKVKQRVQVGVLKAAWQRRRGSALDARNRDPLQAESAFVVNLTRQANGKGGKRAAAAQQPQSLLVAVAPRLQQRQFKQTRRQLECQLQRLLQVVRAHGSASKDGASGCRVQHKTQDVTDTELQHG